jgi:O-antigen ligase/tetratricopeptide (TPR) repeat protein
MLFDGLLTVVTVTLLAGCPLVFGAVHRWPYTVVELLLFTIISGWTVAVLNGWPSASHKPFNGRLIAAIVAFLGVVSLQLLPMPPSLLHRLSPATFDLLAHSLEGWPTTINLAEYAHVDSPRIARLEPSGSSARVSAGLATEPRFIHSGFALWSHFSIAPSLTRAALLTAAVYFGWLFMLVAYRFADGSGEARFIKTVVISLACIGAALSLIGIVELTYWNGKILWFFVPEDWGVPHPELGRASGPFINPDQYANYLAMLLPPTLVACVFGLPGDRHTTPADRLLLGRVFFGISALLQLLGISLSLSRAIWVLTLLAIVALCLFTPLPPALKYRSRIRTTVSARGLYLGHAFYIRACIALAAVLLVLVIISNLLGGAGTANIAGRLQDTVSNPDHGLGVRPVIWSDTWRMFADHPLAGVGFGAWAEAFPHYQQPPWEAMYFTDAHNDYLQYLAETGFLGILPLGLGLWYIASLISHRSADRRYLPLLAAFIVSMFIMLSHELVDFSLRVTANAILFITLLGLTLRLLGGSQADSAPYQTIEHSRAFARLGTVACAFAWLGGCFYALRPDNLYYDADIAPPASIAQADATIQDHPSSAAAHINRFMALGALKAPEADLHDLISAIWLDPTNPYYRDLYAVGLDNQGNSAQSLQAIKESLFSAPDLGAHFYLTPAYLPWRSQVQINAAAEGLRSALKAGEPGALPALAALYDQAGTYPAEARLYETAAHQTGDEHLRSRDYVSASTALNKAGMPLAAMTDLSSAINLDESNGEAYTNLITLSVAEHVSFGSIAQLVGRGIANGNDAATLWLEFAAAEQAAGHNDEAKVAFAKALTYDTSFATTMRVGGFYAAIGQPEQASDLFRQAVQMMPNSADAYYQLGAADEAAYEYAEAGQAFTRAAELAPINYSDQLKAFNHRMAVANSQTPDDGH